jgi:uncharacterized membrane protein
MTRTDFAISRGRLDALTDGLFAIAMTILVLELHAPDLPAGAGLSAFREALMHQWPSMAGYVTSFALLGLFWYQHHWLTHGLRRIDAPFFIANLFFLLLAGSIPFTLALMLRLRTVGGGSVALIPYLICLGGLMLSLALMAIIALRRDLLEPDAPALQLKQHAVGWLLSGLYLLGTAYFLERSPRFNAWLWLPFLLLMIFRRWRARKAKASA